MCDHVERPFAVVRDREEDLDRELVAWRRLVTGHGVPPRTELLGSGRGDPVRALAVALLGLDEPIAREAIEGGVDLPDVE